MSNAIYPVAVPALSGSGISAASHARYYHLHLDIRAVPDVSHHLLEPFVTASAGDFRWTDFLVPRPAEVRDSLGPYATSPSDAVDRLCDPARCGAPLSHLSARKLHLPAASPEFGALWTAFQAGARAMQDSGLTGYVELEELGCRHVLPPHLPSHRRRALPPIPFAPLTLVPLADPAVGRAFRTTEVHCTFERLGAVDVRVLIALLDAGFYTAFLRHPDGALKLILTVQGFEPDIGLVYGLLHGWLLRCAAAGLMPGAVTLKKEDIVGYAVLGEPEECGLQHVIKPLSVVTDCGGRAEVLES